MGETCCVDIFVFPAARKGERILSREHTAFVLFEELANKRREIQEEALARRFRQYPFSCLSEYTFELQGFAGARTISA